MSLKASAVSPRSRERWADRPPSRTPPPLHGPGTPLRRRRAHTGRRLCSPGRVPPSGSGSRRTSRIPPWRSAAPRRRCTTQAAPACAGPPPRGWRCRQRRWSQSEGEGRRGTAGQHTQGRSRRLGTRQRLRCRRMVQRARGQGRSGRCGTGSRTASRRALGRRPPASHTFTATGGNSGSGGFRLFGDRGGEARWARAAGPCRPAYRDTSAADYGYEHFVG